MSIQGWNGPISETQVRAADWVPPTPLTQERLPVFPSSVFPLWLEEFLVALAEATQTPLDLAAMLALSVLAAACQKAFVVKVREGYQESLSLFVVVALPSGSRKSAVFAEVVAPIHALEKRLLAESAERIAASQSLAKVANQELQAAEVAAAKCRPDERPAQLRLVAELARKVQRTPVQLQPRLVVDDCSPERLASLLHEQHGRLAVLSPEGDLFDLMAGRYSQNGVGNFGVFLRGHAGDDLRVDRISRPAEMIEAAALTLGLAVQPEVVRGLASKPGFRGRGLLARFLYAMPASLLGARKQNAPPVPIGVRDRYRAEMTTLLERSLTRLKGSDGPRSLVLDEIALASILRFEAELEPTLGLAGDLAHMTDWAGKLTGAVARISGLLHLAQRSADSAPWEEQISGETVDRATAIAFYLIAHARAAFTEMGADQAIDDAECVLNWIRRSGVGAFSSRDAFEGTKGVQATTFPDTRPSARDQAAGLAVSSSAGVNGGSSSI